MHRGAVGAIALNRALQATLNPVGDALERSDVLYRVGDRVMQLKNDYERDVYNGDVGRITGVEGREKRLLVAFEGRQLSYGFAEMDALALAYACSVHKSQGSEYPAVVLTLHTQHYPLLQRNLLYTAITRGRRLVVVVGSRRALAIATRNGRAGERFTHLAERLRGAGSRHG
jgi:exodeoxyribonuclease V alpha subunit